MPQLITFMMSATADADELVALEACEFWYVVKHTYIHTHAYTYT